MNRIRRPLVGLVTGLVVLAVAQPVQATQDDGPTRVTRRVSADGKITVSWRLQGATVTEELLPKLRSAADWTGC